MATKKEKRQRGLEKRQRFMDAYRRAGLEALQRDREHRLEKEMQAWEKQHKNNHSWTNRVIECPQCRLEMKAAREASESKGDSPPIGAIALAG